MAGHAVYSGKDGDLFVAVDGAAAISGIPNVADIGSQDTYAKLVTTFDTSNDSSEHLLDETVLSSSGGDSEAAADDGYEVLGRSGRKPYPEGSDAAITYSVEFENDRTKALNKGLYDCAVGTKLLFALHVKTGADNATIYLLKGEKASAARSDLVGREVGRINFTLSVSDVWKPYDATA